jgi:hypothetical protein
MIGVKVAKNRQGAPGKFYMHFDAPRMDFREVIDYKPKYGSGFMNNSEVEDIIG